MAEITVYGAPWCPDSRRTKRFLGEARVDFEWVDIGQDPDAAAFVLRQSGGKLTIPTVVLGNGLVLVAPSLAKLGAELGIEASAARRFFDLIIVGAGPAGLSAALYAIREGMHCLRSRYRATAPSMFPASDELVIRSSFRISTRQPAIR